MQESENKSLSLHPKRILYGYKSFKIGTCRNEKDK